MLCPFCKTAALLVSSIQVDDDKLTGDARYSITLSCECSAWSGAVQRVNIHTPSNIKES
jgi:hypothetical protein